MTSGWSMQAVVNVSAADNPLFFNSGQSIGVDCLEISGAVSTDDVSVTATFFPTSYEPAGIIITL